MLPFPPGLPLPSIHPSHSFLPFTLPPPLCPSLTCALPLFHACCPFIRPILSFSFLAPPFALLTTSLLLLPCPALSSLHSMSKVANRLKRIYIYRLAVPSMNYFVHPSPSSDMRCLLCPSLLLSLSPSIHPSRPFPPCHHLP